MCWSTDDSPPVPQGHALAQRHARAGRPAQRAPDAAAAGPGTNGPADRDLQATSKFISEPRTNQRRRPARGRGAVRADQSQ